MVTYTKILQLAAELNMKEVLQFNLTSAIAPAYSKDSKVQFWKPSLCWNNSDNNWPVKQELS